jgi:hypothetical protein
LTFSKIANRLFGISSPILGHLSSLNTGFAQAGRVPGASSESCSSGLPDGALEKMD